MTMGRYKIQVFGAMRIWAAFALVVILTRPVGAEISRFRDPHPEGNVIEYRRLTHDPAIRDHANYHNTDCWSPDGRYVCYTHYAKAPPSGAAEKPFSEIHLVDLHTEKDIVVDGGISPRWAKQHNWLFYSKRRSFGNPWEEGTEIWRLDGDTGKKDLITWGMEFLGSTDSHDRWIYGNQRLRYLKGKQWSTARARIAPQSPIEVIYQNPKALRPLCNPVHDVVSLRAKQKREMFGPSRVWLELDGSNERIGVPMIQDGHVAWSGDGAYQLIGNRQASGRKWNEPFPSDLHLLANTYFGDVSSCGRSGRWICGDDAVADLRSGDGTRVPRPPSGVAQPSTLGDISGHYDADPKGSPDGTKICFVSNFDLEKAPFTWILDAVADQQRITVHSTEGFPEKGNIEIRGEVIGYNLKTPGSFELIERHKYATGRYDVLKKGWYVTAFNDRLMTEKQRSRAKNPPSWMLQAITDEPQRPLLWQRQTDVYVSVVRRPDPPFLMITPDGVTLVPGENHRETQSYLIYRDGKLLSTVSAQPDNRIELPRPGVYSVLAVEWSGLKGRKSNSVTLLQPATLTLLSDCPEDFSWTWIEWHLEGNRVSEEKGRKAPRALREVHHRYDGIIRRETFTHGTIAQAEDMNRQGFAARRLRYQRGVLAEREYWVSENQRISLERFAPDGTKREEVRWEYDRGDRAVEVDHW